MKRARQKGFSMVIIILAVVVIGIGIVGLFAWQQKDKKNNNEAASPITTTPETNQIADFITPKKSAHFESSTPAHGSTLAAVPVDVVIDFNFDLANNSTIKIEKDGKDYGQGETKVDANKLVLRRLMDKSAPDGIYTVNYNACWPDRSCHDGHFQFVINRNLLNTYKDQRGVKEATVTMSQMKFQPMNIRINVGQTVTWVNDDTMEHYVNTDSHPAHTQVPGLNSKALAKGELYSYQFTEVGAYPYHCSAHAADMKGNIVVE